jgi:hypothetical protein
MSFSSLREILPKTLEDLGIANRVWQERVVRAWPAVARALSTDLGARSQAQGLREGVLTVRVADPRLAQLVLERQDELVSALAARLGYRAVQQVRATILR